MKDQRHINNKSVNIVLIVVSLLCLTIFRTIDSNIIAEKFNSTTKTDASFPQETQLKVFDLQAVVPLLHLNCFQDFFLIDFSFKSFAAQPFFVLECPVYIDKYFKILFGFFISPNAP